ncbi:hypothetical protein AX15_002960 [Amanita polypyramis BW_CC]|nr:hypothetical protein AX15_002960 [Amanita polypyramis BW_CC]
MASLPPKPTSSPPPPPGKDEDDRRRHPDERSSRDRLYVPSRSRPFGNSYIATYDRAWDDDRHEDRHRDRDRDRRNWDPRDRAPRGREEDRDRFGYRYDRRRDDTYIPYDDRRSRRPPSPRRSDRHRSRSPRGRRPYSPSRYPPRSRMSRSPPPNRRPRYGNEIPRSPRSPRPRRSHSRSRTPEQRKRDHAGEHLSGRPDAQVDPGSMHTSPSPTKRKPSRSRSRGRSSKVVENNKELPAPNPKTKDQKPSLEKTITQKDSSQRSAPDHVISTKPEPKPSLTSPPLAQQRSPQQQLGTNNNEPRGSPRRETQASRDMDIKMRERTPSPHRQPRHVGSQPTRDGPYARRSSRSPPRGPRNLLKTTPASSTAQPQPPHTSNIHGGRRPAPLGMPPHARPGHGPYDASSAIAEQHAKRANKNERLPVTTQIDAEIARLEGHRANLAAEYVQLAKNARRALHELDMATLDLRAAEARRKVTDSHLDKARSGMLGIDGATVDSALA